MACYIITAAPAATQNLDGRAESQVTVAAVYATMSRAEAASAYCGGTMLEVTLRPGRRWPRQGDVLGTYDEGGRTRRVVALAPAV